MKRAAYTALTQCMGIKKKDSLLIITDKKKKKIAEAFFYEAMPLCRHVLLITIPIGKIHGEEPPKLVAETMKKYDVALLITTMSLSHTNARKAACKKGVRMASMPGITADMMKRCIPVDYNKITKINKKILRLAKKNTKVRITTKLGTDISLIVKNIRGDTVGDNGIYKKQGEFGNLPAGEVCWAPKEGKTNGVFVVDASMFDEKMKTPITIKVKNGYAYEITGGAQAKKLLKMIKPLGKSAFNIAELGIGTNPRAKITGMFLRMKKLQEPATLPLETTQVLAARSTQNATLTA